MTINTEIYFYNQLKILLNQGNLKPNEYTGILISGFPQKSFQTDAFQVVLLANPIAGFGKSANQRRSSKHQFENRSYFFVDLLFLSKRDIWTSIFHLFKIMTSPIHCTGFMSDDFLTWPHKCKMVSRYIFALNSQNFGVFKSILNSIKDHFLAFIDMI